MVRADELDRLAADLPGPMARVRRAAERLDAARLADERLEDQRQAADLALRRVVQEMEAIVDAARAGRPAAVAASSERLADAVESLRGEAGGAME